MRWKAAVEFEKMVALVALVFCCCHVNAAVTNGILFFAEEDAEPERLGENDAAIWLLFGTIANSSVNFFIYLWASPNFRRETAEFFRLVHVRRLG